MLLYLLFWTILGFIFHFYIIFGTNLLTGGPAKNCCFLPISVFRRNGISNGVQTEWNLRERDFLTERDPGDLDPTPRSFRGGHEGGGRAPLGAPPYLVGPLVALRRPYLLLYEVFRWEKNKREPFGTRLRRHEAEPWRNQSRALAELFCRGHFPPGGGNHHHRHHQRSSHRERAISINIFISTISSQNPSSSLVSNSCLQVRDWC